VGWAAVRASSARRSALVNLPLERCGDLLVVVLEGEQRCLDCCQVGEVVGGEDLALDDGEVALDLVELGGVHG